MPSRSDIYFFTDPADIQAQSEWEAFGPVGGSTTRFRVTSLHEGMDGANPTAYAVCKGRVRVQEDKTKSNGSLWTIVLAPDVEILRGVPIQFFVYRGILRDSVIKEDALKKFLPPAQTLINAGTEKDPDKLADALGLAFRPATLKPSSPEFAREDGDAIDSLFFETTNLKAVPVNAGDALGKFDGSGFGFEIMVRSIWPAPTLELLRKVSLAGGKGNVIDTSTVDAAHARAMREKVYQYLDPCAFYGMCYDRNVSYKVAASPSSVAMANAQQLFDDVLVKFQNCHKVYLDIRNENGLSYNYYDTYGSGEILLGLDTALLERRRGWNNPLTEAQKESYDTQSWPLKIIDPAKFAVPSKATKAGIRVALNIGHKSAILQRHVFYDFAYLFYNKNDKKRRNHIFETRGTLRWENVLKDGDWTKDVVLAVPAVTNNGGTWPIAFHARMRYFRQNEPQPDTKGRYISTGGQWDNIFILRTDVERWKNTNTSNWWLTGQIKHVQTHLEDQQVYDGRVEAGFAVDRDPVTLAPARFTFYYVPIHVDRYEVKGGINEAGTGGAFGSSAGSFFQRKESGTTITGSKHLQLHKVSEFYEWNPNPLKKPPPEPPENPSDYLNFLTFLENPEFAEANDKTTNPNHSKESLYAISFSAAEYTTLLSYVVKAGLDLLLHPAFLQVRNRIYPRTDETATERAYQALELRIVGLDQAGNYCSFDVPSSGPGAILPLSLPADGFLFCTNDAARFEGLKPKWDYILICTQFRDYESTPTPAMDAQHRTDFIYFGRAMTDLKRFHPKLYDRMSKLRSDGVEVILPGETQASPKRYQIKVFFDDKAERGEGETVSPPFPPLIHIRDLQTDASLPPPTDPDLRKFGGINETRYVRLNAARSLKPSEVSEQFMSDYTDAELAANQILANRLYVERASSAGSNAPRLRTTLAELTALGLGAFDPTKPFEIRLHRPRLYNEDYYPEKFIVSVPSTTSSGKLDTITIRDLNPRRLGLAKTLAHELGHAESHIRNPLAYIVWNQLEEYFYGTVFTRRQGTGKLATSKDVPSVVKGTGTLFKAELGERDNVTIGSKTYSVKAVIDDKTLNLDASEIETATGLSFSIVKVITMRNAKTDPMKFSFENFKLLGATAYPNPKLTVNPNSDTDVNKEFNKRLYDAGFMAKTGSGHLRGSPSGQNSCEAGMKIMAAMATDADKLIKKGLGERKVTVPPYSYEVDYCFLNLEESNRNPPPE